MSNWPEPKKIDTGTVNLAYYEYGDPSNPTALMLHGFLSTGLTWHDVSAALADRWHVISLDQRGRGLSQAAPYGDYSTEAYVADAHAVLEKLGISKVALAGHSMGGGIALQFAAAYPDMVTSIVIVDMAPEVNRDAASQVAAGVAALDRDFSSWDEARTWQSAVLPLISEDAVARRLHSRMVERNGRIDWREDRGGILKHRDNNPMAGPEERWKTLRGVKCRTLFLLGGDSGLVSDETAEKAANTVPEGKWMRVPGAGHNVFEDNPSDSIAAICDFLNGDSQQA